MIAQVLNKLCVHVEAGHFITIPLPPSYTVRIILHATDACLTFPLMGQSLLYLM